MGTENWLTGRAGTAYLVGPPRGIGHCRGPAPADPGDWKERSPDGFCQDAGSSFVARSYFSFLWNSTELHLGPSLDIVHSLLLLPMHIQGMLRV